MAAFRKSFPFFPGDWMKDPNLRRCSPAARGVWVDLMCLMFESEEPGVLISRGRAWPKEDIAAAVGGETVVVLRCLEELIEKGVLHQDSRGAYYSRRLQRHAEIRRRRQEADRRRKERAAGEAGDSEGVAIVDSPVPEKEAAPVRWASARAPQARAIASRDEGGQRWQIQRQLRVLNHAPPSRSEPTLDSPASEVFR